MPFEVKIGLEPELEIKKRIFFLKLRILREFIESKRLQDTKNGFFILV